MLLLLQHITKMSQLHQQHQHHHYKTRSYAPERLVFYNGGAGLLVQLVQQCHFGDVLQK